MYYKNRGSRGGSKKKVMSSSVGILIPDDAQLERTLGLVGVDGKNKPCINDLMCAIVERLEREQKAADAEYYSRWYDRYGDESIFFDSYGEDDFPDDDYPHYGLSKKEMKRLMKGIGKQGRKKGKSKGKRHRHIDFDDEDIYNNVDSEWKEINFYPEIDNELSVIQFHSIKEFSDYCEENEISVGNIDGDNLMNWDRIHCCLDPLSLKYGEKGLITDTSYGALYWTVADDIESNGVAAV